MAKDSNNTVTDFVSSFKRKPATAPEPAPEATPELNSSPEPPAPMQALTAPANSSETAPETPTLKVERAEEPEKQKGRKDPAPAEQAGRIDYAETFLSRGRERKTKAIYLTEDAHRTLSAIIAASDGTPLADLLANILTHHFETYGPDIRAFLAEQEKKNKKRLMI
jgi:hypothetical protein